MDIRQFLIIVVISMFISLTAQSSDIWTGSSDGDWDNADNWDSGVVPGAGADIVFPDVVNRNINLDGNRDCNMIGFSSLDSYTFYNGALTLGTNVNQAGAGNVLFNCDINLGEDLTFTGDGTGAVEVNGSMNEISGAYRVTLNTTNYIVVLAGANAYSGGTYLITNATIRVAGHNTLGAATCFSASRRSSGTLILDSNSSLPFGEGSWVSEYGTRLTILAADSSSRVVSNVVKIRGDSGNSNWLITDGPGDIEFSEGFYYDMNVGVFNCIVSNPVTTVANMEFNPAKRLLRLHKLGPGALVIQGENESARESTTQMRFYEGTIVFANSNFLSASSFSHYDQTTGTVVFASDSPYVWGASNLWSVYSRPGALIFRSSDTNERAFPGFSTSQLATYDVRFEGEGNIRMFLGLKAYRNTTTISNSNPRVIIEGVADVSYPGCKLKKDGPGVLEIATNCVATWVNNVDGGTLMVNGFITSNLTMNVASGAVLGGSGKTAQTVVLEAGATLSPGDGGAGVLSIANLTLNTGAMYEWKFDNALGNRCDVVENLILPDGQPVVVRLIDLGKGYIKPDREFVLFTYTGADPTDPEWTFDYVGDRWGQCNPLVTVDTVEKQVVLTGISIPEIGTIFSSF